MAGETKITENALSELVARRWFAPLMAALLLGAALWVMTRAWDASLLDRYQFRQTQTALTAKGLQEQPFRFAYPTPIFGPPWSVPFEFPLYQWLVARLANATGMPLVSAARSVGISFFLLALPAIYGLAARVERDARRRLLIPAAVLCAPVCLFYARAFMIESCAASLAVWFWYLYVRSLEKPSWRWTSVATVVAIFAALVKITTFALFVLPAAIFAINRLWRAWNQPRTKEFSKNILKLASVSLLPGIVALTATIWWLHVTDAVKASNPFSAQLTSKNLTQWNYGTLEQRMDPVFWRNTWHQLTHGALSGWNLLLLAIGLFVVGPRYRRAALICLAGFLIGPLVFSNLYAIHEYYYFPSAFFAAAAAGIVLAGVVESTRLRNSAKTCVLLAFVTLQAVNFNRDYANTLKHPPAPPPPLMDVIRQATPSDGIVLIYGWDWNALIPYYTERRAILIPSGRDDDVESLQTILASLGSEQVSAMVVVGSDQREPGFLRWRTDRLNLVAQPVAKSPDGDLFLPANRIEALQTEFADHSRYPGVQFNFSSPVEQRDLRLVRHEPDPARYAEVATPAPFAVFTPWSIEVDPLDGQPTIFANAPSELHFHAPSHATRITATVGLNDGAYTGPTPTDGVDVVIFEELPAGGRRVLYRRNLNPVSHLDDRGPQTLLIEGIGPIIGPLVFAIYPGPADNMACDWSYWRNIKID